MTNGLTSMKASKTRQDCKKPFWESHCCSQRTFHYVFVLDHQTRNDLSEFKERVTRYLIPFKTTHVLLLSFRSTELDSLYPVPINCASLTFLPPEFDGKIGTNGSVPEQSIRSI